MVNFVLPLALFQGMVILLISALYAESNTPSTFTITAKAAAGNSQADPSTMAEEINSWRELKYGMFIHYGMSTYDGEELSDGTTPVQEYNPTNLDVDQWVRVAKEAGMKYIVLTAKHVAGFCFWDSKVQWKGEEFSYDIAASPVKTDVVAAFMEACNKYGITPGIYYCAMDRRHSFQNIQWNPNLPCLSNEYFQLMKDHLTELHTRHPSIAIQWIDIPRHLNYEQRAILYSLIRNLNPECLIEYNYGKESGGLKGEYTIQEAMKVTWPTDILNSEVNTIKQPFQERQEYDGKKYVLGYEHCISLIGSWFWKKGSNPKSLDVLTAVWDKTNKLNGNLLLNVPPDKAGRIPEAFIQRLDALRRDIGIVSIAPPIGRGFVISEPGFKLNQYYLNPFNPSLTIDNSNGSNNVILRIYNLSGQEMETVVFTPNMAEGPEITWQPKTLPRGKYLGRLYVAAPSAGPGQ